jgi:hypothetical protein
MGVGVKEMVDRDPAGSSDFCVGGQCRTGWDQKHERPYRDRWKDRGSRDDVIEAPRHMLPFELHPDFFPGLPNRGAEKVFISRLATATGQGHVTPPGISSALGSSDQKYAVGLGADNDCDGGPEQGCVIVGGRVVSGQPLPEAKEPGGQCEWEWQPPPQQPPPGGGPSRL